MAYIGSGLTRFNTADDLTVTDDAEIGGDLTVTGSADINGGTIDGVTIGGASAGAGTFTTLQADTSLNVDGTVTADGLTVDGTANITYSRNADEFTGIELSNTNSGAGSFSGISYGTNGTGTQQWFVGRENQSSAALQFCPATAGTPTVVFEYGGNVGIGQTTNLAKFTVNGGTANIVSAFRSTDAGAYIGFADNTTTLDASIYPYVFAGASGNDFLLGTNNSEAMRIDSSGNVGIGTSSPTAFGGSLVVDNNGQTDALIVGDLGTSSNDTSIYLRTTGEANIKAIAGADFTFTHGTTERMRIDSSGNVLVGKTGTSSATDGVAIFGGSATGTVTITRNDNRPFLINRRTSDGALIELRKDNTSVGEIGADAGDLYIGTNAHGLRFADGSADIRPFNTSTGADTNGSTDLGGSGVRFREIFATNGTINVSDKNEKQDIEELSEAEQRVAVAAKGLLRKFRWKDMVAEKGDDARIHFGIMAQDLQAAFEAEGLDAGRYSMFVKETYYELLTDVPAVEAVDAVYETVTDEEGNETQVLVSEAVEAKEAYTRRRVYKAHEEIPEGAQAVTTYGVRYSELLAFIIAAI